MNLKKAPNRLIVTYHGKEVGTLALSPDKKNRCIFQYSRQWLSTGFSISPLQMPLKESIFIAPEIPFWGNFGIFEDSLPDGYGRYLLARMLKKQGIDETRLTALQRLGIVGSRGMGALCYSPQLLDIDYQPLPSLDDVQNQALELLRENDNNSELMLYFNSNNSGGCRPKCIINDAAGQWIVKFRHTYDPIDMGEMEFKLNEAASRCGIKVPNHRLLNGKYFASRRFDISLVGERLHIATAGALLNESIDSPKLDYTTLLQLTGFLTQDPKQVEQMFRVMVFNVVTENKDDHPKNFSFICRAGKWELAPAYDLTYSPEGYNGEHATSVCYNGNPTVNDIINAGKKVNITARASQQIIDEIVETCREMDVAKVFLLDK